MSFEARWLADCVARITEVSELLRSDPEVAFEPWETELLPAVASRHSTANLVAVENNQAGDIIAAVVGGSFLRRATISHQTTAERSRSRGIGRQLARQVIEQAQKSRAKTLHVIVTPGNDGAFDFWHKKLGLERVTDRKTLERDIDPSEFLGEGLEPMRMEDVAQSVRLVGSDAQERTARRIHAALDSSDGTCLALKDGGQVVAWSVVGSFGVRGNIRQIAGPPECSPRLVGGCLKFLQERRVGRVHAFVGAREDEFGQQLEACGFSERSGETTLEVDFARAV